MRNLKNLITYSEFVNEGSTTHQYTLYVDDEAKLTADYSTVLNKFNKLKETSEIGTKLEIYKTQTNTGEEVMELKKSHVVSKSDKEVKKKKQFGEKAKKEIIKETILDVFNDPYIPNKKEQFEQINVGDEENKLDVYLNSTDYLQYAPNLKGIEPPDKYSAKYYGSPYLVDVKKVEDESGVELTYENIRRIEKRPINEDEEDAQQNLKLAKNDTSKEKKYKITIYLDIKENPDYGKKPSKIKDDETEEQEEKDEWTEEEKRREREEEEGSKIDPSQIDPDFL